MKRLLGIVLIVAFVVVALLGSVHTAKASDCCTVPSASNCYACLPQTGPQGVLQQGNIPTDSATLYQQRGDLATAELGVRVNIAFYGGYWVRDAQTGRLLADWEITPAMRWRISEISATGR